MQTFLPYSDYKECAKILDNKRCGKQRVEAFQILKSLLIKDSRWKNHPAVKMWKGYERSLFDYMCAMIDEWGNRGFKNDKMNLNRELIYQIVKYNNPTKPKWLNDEIIISHRSNLLRKDKVYYSKYFINNPENLQKTAIHLTTEVVG